MTSTTVKRVRIIRKKVLSHSIEAVLAEEDAAYLMENADVYSVEDEHIAFTFRDGQDKRIPITDTHEGTYFVEDMEFVVASGSSIPDLF